MKVNSSALFCIGKAGFWNIEYKAGMNSLNGTRQSLTMIMSMLDCTDIKRGKFSVCIESRKVYDSLVKFLKNFSIKNEVSIILIDNETVIDEFIIPIRDGLKRESCFFKKKIDRNKPVVEMEWDKKYLNGGDRFER